MFRLKEDINLKSGITLNNSFNPELQNRMDALSEALKLNYQTYDDKNNYHMMEAFGTIFQKVSTSKAKIIRQVDMLESSFYLVTVLVDQITEDALNPDLHNGDIFTIKYAKNEKVEKELQKLEKDLNLDEFICDITPDALKYGEYVVEVEIDKGEDLDLEDLSTGKKKKIKTKSKGVTALRDSLCQQDVVVLSDETEQQGFLVKDETGKIYRKGNASMLAFSYGPSKIRVPVKDQLEHFATYNKKFMEFIKTLPRYIRIGKSLIYPFLDKFKELQLLEKLVPATKLSKLSNVNLVGMNVPQNYDLQKGMNAARTIEGFVNNKVGVDKQLGEITVESILSVAGRTKVVPMFGDKGGLEKLDYQSDEPDDMLNSVKELREVVCDSIGVPYELLFKSDGGSKGELLKRYAKYLRRLKNVQKMIIKAVKRLCCIHLMAIGITDFDEDEIEIEFNNKLIEIDNLDRLEHADITVNLIRNIRDFFVELTDPESPFAGQIDLEQVSEFINRNLRTIGLSDAINTEKEGGEKAARKKEDDLLDTDLPDDDLDKDLDKDLDSTDTDGDGIGGDDLDPNLDIDKELE